jgi:hypothetical protein
VPVQSAASLHAGHDFLIDEHFDDFLDMGTDCPQPHQQPVRTKAWDFWRLRRIISTSVRLSRHGNGSRSSRVWSGQPFAPGRLPFKESRPRKTDDHQRGTLAGSRQMIDRSSEPSSLE